MKIPTLFVQKKKLRVSAARRSVTDDDMDYEEMSEPNMKLSRALLIVLVLHVVAVAGIIAFNTIKGRQGAFPQKTTASAASSIAAKENGATKDGGAIAPAVATSAKATPAPSKPLASVDQAKPALPVSGPPAETGKFHVVVKGENPVSIAKKWKVSESELLSVNHIDDPRKLQIGQKLIIPPPKKTKAKPDAN